MTSGNPPNPLKSAEVPVCRSCKEFHRIEGNFVGGERVEAVSGLARDLKLFFDRLRVSFHSLSLSDTFADLLGAPGTENHEISPRSWDFSEVDRPE